MKRVQVMILIRASRVYTSFGGLLLQLEGPFKRLTTLRVDYVYLLMRKA